MSLDLSYDKELGHRSFDKTLQLFLLIYVAWFGTIVFIIVCISGHEIEVLFCVTFVSLLYAAMMVNVFIQAAKDGKDEVVVVEEERTYIPLKFKTKKVKTIPFITCALCDHKLLNFKTIKITNCECVMHVACFDKMYIDGSGLCPYCKNKINKNIELYISEILN